MSDVIFGSNAYMEVLYAGVYTPIGCALSCQFAFENELILKTDANAGLFRKRRVRMSDNSASISGLTTLINDATLSILYFLQEGVRRSEVDLRFRFTDTAGQSRQIQGLFLVQSISITGDASAFSEFDLELQGTAGVTITTFDPAPEQLPGDVQSDWWETTPGASSITGVGEYGRTFVGKEVLEVAREGTQHDEAGGSPGNREYAYDGTNISFDPTNPFNPGERVFVIWQELES